MKEASGQESMKFQWLAARRSCHVEGSTSFLCGCSQTETSKTHTVKTSLVQYSLQWSKYCDQLLRTGWYKPNWFRYFPGSLYYKSKLFFLLMSVLRTYMSSMVCNGPHGQGGCKNKAWQEEVDFTCRSQRGGHCTPRRVTGQTPACSGDRRQEWGESLGQSLIWGFLGKG